ncbi:hypothetical protein C8Q80DRAFT_1058252, partial [Daedaleopsis nitida]
MAGKSLSNGTLSLRFMQNAHRAKQQAQVEAEQAKIKDDAEWSVSMEVRDAWGIGSSIASARTEIEHETSYLPFIFQSDLGEGPSGSQSSSGARPRGRRTFNARGKEVIEDLKSEEPEDVQIREKGQGEDHKPRTKFEKRPTSISGFKGSLSTRRDEKKPRMKTAQMLIREDIPVRAPLPSPPQSFETASIPSATGFIKPAGVDDPVPLRLSTEGRKRDREHDPNVTIPASEGKKRKK